MTKFQTILLAILAGVAAGLLYKFVPSMQEVAAGLASLSLFMLGWAKQHPADAAAASPIVVQPEVRDPQKGSATIEQLIDIVLPVVAAGLSALVFWLLLSFAWPSKSRADGLVLDLSPTWTCSPVGMLTGMQYNVKTGDFQKGVALGMGYGCRYTGWKVPLGIEAVGGMAVNSNAPNAAQGSLIFTIADNYGIGPGAQMFKDPSTGNITGQMLVSFFLTGSWASTIDQLSVAKSQAAQRARAGQ